MKLFYLITAILALPGASGDIGSGIVPGSNEEDKPISQKLNELLSLIPNDMTKSEVNDFISTLPSDVVDVEKLRHLASLISKK